MASWKGSAVAVPAEPEPGAQPRLEHAPRVRLPDREVDREGGGGNEPATPSRWCDDGGAVEESAGHRMAPFRTTPSGGAPIPDRAMSHTPNTHSDEVGGSGHGTRDGAAPGDADRRRRDPPAARRAGRRGAAGDPGRRAVARRDHADPGPRRRAGPRLPAHRGRDRRPRGRLDGPLLRLAGRRRPQHLQRPRHGARPRRAAAGRLGGAALLHHVLLRGVRQGVAGRRAHPAPASPPATTRCASPTEVLAGLPDTLRAAQAVFDSTGGLHAAGLFRADGTLLVAREDVGRAQRRRQGRRPRAARGRGARARHRAHGLRARVVRADPEGRHGRHPRARRGVGPVVPGRRDGPRVRDDARGLPARRRR